MNLFIKTLIIVFMIGCSEFKASGQKIQPLRFQILNHSDNTAISGATVVLKNIKEETIAKGASNDRGIVNFTLKDSISPYRIDVSAIGFKNRTDSSQVLVSESRLFTIFLDPDTIMMKDVQVFDKQITRDGGKITYRVKQDQFSSAKTITSLFNKLPGVSLINGSVKLFDKANILILVNGKGELKDQSAQLVSLSSLSADQVEKIEINNFPSGQYDASVNAVINIVTKKKRNISNLNGSIQQPLFKEQGQFGSRYLTGGGSGNLNFEVSKVRVSFLMNVRKISSPERKDGEVNIYNISQYQRSFNSISTYLNLNPELTLDYDISKRSSISLDADISIVPYQKNDQKELYRFYNSSGTTLDSTSEVNSNNRINRKSIYLTTNYKYVLSEKSKSTLFINFIYSGSPSETKNILDKNSPQSGFSSINNLTDSRTDIYNFSTILTEPVKTSYLSSEIGLKFNSLVNNSNQKLNTSSTLFRYSEQISSLFLNLKWKFGPYRFVSELRNEFLKSAADFKSSGDFGNLDKKYFQAYPHFLLSRNFGEDWSLSLGYIKRVKRPYVNFLNPSLIINSFYTSLSGSITNLPSYIDRFEFQTAYKDYSLTFFHESVSNQMFFKPSENPFIYINSNLGRIYKNGVAANVGLKAGEWLAVNLNSSIYITQKAADDNVYNRNRWTVFDVGASADMRLGKKSSIQVDAYYSPAFFSAYDRYGKQIFTTLTYRQVLVKDKWTMSVSVEDPLGLQKNQTQGFYPNLYSSLAETTNNRMISAKLTYSFPFGSLFRNQTYKKQNDGEIRN